MLLPLDDRPRLSSRRPWTTWSLAALLVVCHAAALGSAGGADGGGPGDLVWAYRAEQPSLAGLVTHLAVHGDALHLLGNVLFLLVFGPNVERRLGPPRALALFLACGATGALAFSLVEREGLLIGASGAALGWTAFHAVALPGQRVLLLVWVLVVWIGEVPARLLALLLLALDLVALSTSGFGGGRVAVSAHLGGWLAGAAAGALLRYVSSRANEATRAMPASISASEQA